MPPAYDRYRIIRTVLLVIVTVLAGGLIAYIHGKADLPSTNHAPILNVAGVGGPFSLIDQDNTPRSEKDYKDDYKLIYFGFTFCPAICPTELQKMAQTLHGIGAVEKKIQPIFISIDPERDTAAVLKKYITLFHPRLVGLTGTAEQIDLVKKNFKVYAAKVPPAQNAGKDEYMMDHTSFIYFLGPEDSNGNSPLIALFRTEDTAQTMIETIQKEIKP